MESKTFTVPNMGCNGCVNSIKSELKELNGIKSVETALDTKSVTVQYESPATWEQIVTTLTEIDYAPANA